ncbi:hypothetical protein CHCC14437_2359 [Bacillus licheniformis]|nr:hypothetical protein CHCC15289_2592 [Bacillus licheniformis]TWN61904.1 hypothetical protein CHCC14437_2359 [Bacillus licheniformis]
MTLKGLFARFKGLESKQTKILRVRWTRKKTLKESVRK